MDLELRFKELEDNLTASIQKIVREALAPRKARKRKSLLTEEEAAHLLNLAKGTLPIWRYRGQGPKYIKCGSSVRYSMSDLVTYVTEQTVSPDKQ